MIAPWVFKTNLAYTITDKQQSYVGIDFSQQTFFRADRTEKKDRIYFADKKAFVGYKIKNNDILSTEIETGYAFDRKLFEAKSYSFSPDSPLNFDPSWFAKISLSAGF